jgi:sialic acid synthase
MGRTLSPCILRDGQTIGDGYPCFVVAEVGQNHQGDVYTAARLIGGAARAGVSAIKLCKRHVPSDLTAVARAARYNGPHSFGSTYGAHRRALELSIGAYRHLQDRVRYNRWPCCLFATACDLQSLDELERYLDPPLYKIASRDLDNGPLVAAAAATGKPVILSAGMGDLHDVARALGWVYQHHEQVVLLHSTMHYPTLPEAVALDRMDVLRREFNVLIGLSDHTAGIVAAQTAAARGAAVVEKHITFSRQMRGRDHCASITLPELTQLVANIRTAERMRGTVHLRPDSETHHRLARSLVAARAIAAGERITEEMLTLKSPGGGLRWKERYALLGCYAVRRIDADELLRPEAVVAYVGRSGGGPASHCNSTLACPR